MVTGAQDYNMQAETEGARKRALAVARQNEVKVKKQAHLQQLSGNIQSSHATSMSQAQQQPETGAQQKQAIKQKQRWYARTIKARKKKKKKKVLTKKYEKIIRKYQKTSWILLYVVAFSDALFDILSVPFLSTGISFCLSLYINIALWRIGKKGDRQKTRIIRGAVSLLDLIPIINFIPFSVVIVYKAQNNEKKRVKRARRIIKKLNK